MQCHWDNAVRRIFMDKIWFIFIKLKVKSQKGFLLIVTPFRLAMRAISPERGGIVGAIIEKYL